MNLRTALLLVGLPLGLVTLDFTIPNASAQTNSWTNSASGYWQDATKWSLGVSPDSTQSLLITNASGKTVLIDSSTSSGYSNTMSVSDVILAGQTGATNTLLISNIGSNPPVHILNSLIVNPGGALLTTNSALVVDNGAGGAVDIEGATALSGTNFLAGGLYVGFATNSTASVSVIDGQTAFTNGYMTVGFYGSAQVTLLSGTLQTEDNITITNGSLVGPGSAPNGLFVGLGPASQGVLSIPGGTLVVPEHLSLGEDAGAAGLLSVDGGQLIATNNYLLSIGGNGTGQVVVSSGQLAASCLIVGNAMGSSGMLTIAGGTVNLSGAMVVAQGQFATGSVFITGGQLTATNQASSLPGLSTGQLSTTIASFGVGQMAISNGSLLAQSIIVADCENSQGTLTIAGGTVSVASNLTAGALAYIGTATNANASGTIEITGGSLTVTNQSRNGLLTIGQLGKGLFVQNGGLVLVDQLTVGAMNLSNVVNMGTNVYLVAGGVGQAVLSNGQLFAQTVAVGLGTNTQGALTIAGGQISAASNMLVGVFPGASGVVQVTSGDLYVTNQSETAQLVVGLAGLAAFAQSGGGATVDQLLVTNGPYNVVVNHVTNIDYSTFNLGSGVFNTRSTAVSNGLGFDVGDGTDPATYHLLGGVHSFANGVEVRNNAVLSGCGTINGAVLIDPGGMVVADCGGVLTFTGIVTNNGVVIAANGGTVESYGSVDNNGTIDIINGNTNFHAGFVNNGVVLTSNSVPQIISIAAVGPSIQVQFTTATNLTYVFEYTGNLLTGSWTPLVGFTGLGGNVTVTDYNAILQTQRFYRVRLVVTP
jgi:hypothetical protein